MKRALYLWIILTLAGLLIWGCATPGQKFITISYLADHETQTSGPVGIALFTDHRKDMDDGYVGYRVLFNNNQETYFVNGMNLAASLTQAVETYFSKSGAAPSRISSWTPTPEGVMAASSGFEKIVSGQINQFECRAEKKGAITEMVLDIDLTLYLGLPETRTMKKIPVALTLERTEFTFSQEKLEGFINQSLEEVIKKAFDPQK